MQLTQLRDTVYITIAGPQLGEDTATVNMTSIVTIFRRNLSHPVRESSFYYSSQTDSPTHSLDRPTYQTTNPYDYPYLKQARSLEIHQKYPPLARGRRLRRRQISDNFYLFRNNTKTVLFTYIVIIVIIVIILYISYYYTHYTNIINNTVLVQLVQ